MQRVYRCFDLLQAHVMVASLRHDGIEAHVFDADFVRQDWFKMLAYGGFRIVVPNHAAAEAVENIKQYQAGALALDDAEAAVCPNCQEPLGCDDPQPRRNVFLILILLSLIEVPAFLAWKPSTVDILAAFAVQMGLYISVPWLVIRYIKWRYRCDNCRYRWREPPQNRYADLRAAVEAAEDN